VRQPALRRTPLGKGGKEKGKEVFPLPSSRRVSLRGRGEERVPHHLGVEGEEIVSSAMMIRAPKKREGGEERKSFGALPARKKKGRGRGAIDFSFIFHSFSMQRWGKNGKGGKKGERMEYPGAARPKGREKKRGECLLILSYLPWDRTAVGG